MSYLGMGIQPPEPSWGRMLFEAQVLFFNAPWCAIAPGIFIMLTVIAFHLLGEGLRKRFGGKMPLLTVKNLTAGIKKDGKTLEILKNVSFSIDEGEIVGLAGRIGLRKKHDCYVNLKPSAATYRNS